MLIYSVTASIEKSIENEWLEWIQKHIPEVLATGCFVSAQLAKLTSHPQEDCTNYSIQYHCESSELLKQYKTSFAPNLKKEGAERFGKKMITFRTELTILSVFKA